MLNPRIVMNVFHGLFFSPWILKIFKEINLRGEEEKVFPNVDIACVLLLNKHKGVSCFLY